MHVLNMIEDWSLVDLNVDTPNVPVVDLGDKHAKVCVQVTAEDRSSKIKDTINDFLAGKVYEEYTRLVFLMIAGKKNYSTPFATEGKFNFSREKDIWDIDDLLEKIEQLPLDKLHALNEYLNKELAPIVQAIALPKSLLSKVEKVIASPPKDASKFLQLVGCEPGDEFWEDEVKKVKKFYKLLSKRSREEREYLLLIMTRGEITSRSGIRRFRIGQNTLRSVFNDGGTNDGGCFAALDDAGLVTADPDYPPVVEIHFTLECDEDIFVHLRRFCKDDDAKLERILVDGDFTLLD